MVPYSLLRPERDRAYALFNPVNNCDYELNLSACRILEWCDGVRTEEEIVAEYTREFRTDREEAADEVAAFLERMRREGIVAFRECRMDAAKDCPPPSQVFWDITAACNLRCGHCYNPVGSSCGEELPAETVCRAIGEMAHIGVEHLTFSGGEPLLRKDFPEIAAHAASLGLAVGLATNGTLVTRETARLLKDRDIDVQVSLDGDTPGLQDRIRGAPGAFEGAVRGIRHLLREGVRVTVCTTVTKLNVDRIPRLIELAGRLGVDAYRVQGMMPMGRGKDLSGRLGLSPARMKRLVEYLESRKVPVSSYNFTLNPPSGGDADLSCSGACSAATTICSITPEGSVVPCTYFGGLNGENLRDHTFPWIWENSTLLRYFRNFRLDDIRGFCRGCAWLSLCHGGCKAENYSRGDLFASRSNCWVLDEHRRRKKRERSSPEESTPCRKPGPRGTSFLIPSAREGENISTG